MINARIMRKWSTYIMLNDRIAAAACEHEGHSQRLLSMPVEMQCTG
jgi:hypothetical protein